MRTEAEVSDHYTHGGLLDAVRAAIHQIGKTAENVTVEDLAGVDEFHIGGRPASVGFFLLSRADVERSRAGCRLWPGGTGAHRGGDRWLSSDGC